jgi:hypothetical protein
MMYIIYLLAIIVPAVMLWIMYLAVSEDTGERNIFKLLTRLPKSLLGLIAFMLYGWVLTTVVVGTLVVVVVLALKFLVYR